MRAIRAIRPFLLGVALLGAAPTIDGTFALQTRTAKTRGHLRATQRTRDPLERHLDLWLTRAGSQTIRHYDVDMTKFVHLVAVSDDFTTYMHLHPTLQRDGHFLLDQRFPKAALYHLYSDGEPDGIGQQVFRYDVTVGSPGSAPTRDMAPTGSRVRTGPYAVSLDSTTLRAGSETAIAVHVREGGEPAKSLRPYLGAPAHAVFLNPRDLTYVHVHPLPLGAKMAMNGMKMGAMPMPATATTSPDMTLHVAVRETGRYKLWFEFRGSGGRLFVAPFVITAT